MRVVREGVPEENGALMRMVKYDGSEKEPQWMDVEPGTAFNLETRFPCLALTTRKTSSRPCAMWLPIFLRYPPPQ